MTDRELLELAAKAVGIELIGFVDVGGWADCAAEWGHQTKDFDRWNPLTDDGDALRLAVKLDFHLQMDFDNDEIECVYCWSTTHSDGSPERITHAQDRYAATRRAIQFHSSLRSTRHGS